MKEIYKNIPDYNGMYQVSNLGNVKSFKNNKNSILKISISNQGYNRVNLSKNGVVKKYRVYNLIAITFLNHMPNRFKIVVDHIDGNSLNDNLDNLQLITHRENISKQNRDTTTGVVGVYFNKKAKRYTSQINIDGVRRYLGCFKTISEANISYQNALKNINL